MPKYDIVTASSTRELVNIVNRRKAQGWVESGAPGYNYTGNVYFQAMTLSNVSPMEIKYIPVRKPLASTFETR